MPSRYHISPERKAAEGRGQGIGANYVPYIKAQELNSKGTASVFPDFKNGRAVHLLSSVERDLYLILRYSDEVEEVYEQYPLNINVTNRIADELMIRKSQNGIYPMTTDLVTYNKDGTKSAYSCKYDMDSIDTDRKKDLLEIEKRYWEEQNAKFKVIFRSDINAVYASNIAVASRYYDPAMVRNKYDFVKFLVIRKLFRVDMESEPVDFVKLAESKEIERYLDGGVET